MTQPSAVRVRDARDASPEPVRVADCGFLPEVDDFPDWSTVGAPPLPDGRWAENSERARREATDALSALFHAFARYWGAIGHAERLAKANAPPEDCRPTFRVLATLDHFVHRACPPRPRAGDGTNRDNDAPWARLSPYLSERLLGSTRENHAESLLWRSVLTRIPEAWLPIAAIENRLTRRFGGTPPIDRLGISVTVAGAASGGLRWIAEKVAVCLTDIERTISAGNPVAVEIIDDPWAPPSTARVVLAWRISASRNGFLLDCHDFQSDGGILSLNVRHFGDRVRIEARPRRDDRPSIQAIRIWKGEAAVPPYFGLRRFVPFDGLWSIPWRIRRWFLKRRRAPGTGRTAPNADPPTETIAGNRPAPPASARGYPVPSR